MLRVLVVDDCTDTTASLSILMTLWGHEVRVANSGPAAVAEAAREHPDVIFLDLAMPCMDGCETARRLRALPGARRALLVALTGLSDSTDRIRSSEAGFDLHLVKPLGPDDLREVLASRASPSRAG